MTVKERHPDFINQDDLELDHEESHVDLSSLLTCGTAMRFKLW